MTVTKEHVADAIAHLTAAKSTSIKQILKAKGNPLAAADYWSVINAHKAAHPVELQHGTKQAHVAGAKTIFLSALQEHLDSLTAGDTGTGHTVAADLHEAVSGGQQSRWTGASRRMVLWPWRWSPLPVMDRPGMPTSSAEPGVWTVQVEPPADGKDYFEVTPEHGVTMHLSDGSDARVDARSM